VDRIHSECALKTIKGDFASCLFLLYICHHNEKNPNEDTLPFIRDIPLSQMTDSSVPDSRNRDIVEKFSDKYKLDIDLSSASTTVGDLIDSYLGGHSTPGSRKAIEDAIDKHDNKVNLSSHDILMTIRDNQAELILDAVDLVVYLSRKLGNLQDQSEYFVQDPGDKVHHSAQEARLCLRLSVVRNCFFGGGL
jgi:hypothetical protein